MTNRTIKPREDGCYVYFHPTTVRVLQAIEDHLDDGYSMTWAKIAGIVGIAESTLYRHLDALVSVEYLDRGNGKFGSLTQQMSLNDEPEYECVDGEYVG